MTPPTDYEISQLIIEGHDFDEIVTPIAERIPVYFHAHYIVFWFIIGIIFTSVHTTITGLYEGTNISKLWPSISLGMLPFVIVIINIYFSKILEEFTPSLILILKWKSETTLTWYSNQIKMIFSDKNMFFSGLITNVIFLPMSFFGPIFPSKPISQASFIITIIFINFASGGLLYSLFMMIRMIHSLGKTNAVTIPIYQHPITSIKAVGHLMTKISLSVLMIFVYGTSYTIYCDNDIITIGTTIASGIIVLTIFIFPQVQTHKIMSKVKHERLIQFSSHLEKALQDITSDPSSQNLSQIKELFAIQKSLNSMNEWPFDTKMLLSILSSIAIPIIAIAVQIIFIKA